MVAGARRNTGVVLSETARNLRLSPRAAVGHGQTPQDLRPSRAARVAASHDRSRPQRIAIRLQRTWPHEDGQQQAPRERPVQAKGGSGRSIAAMDESSDFVVDDAGHIVTSQHIVAGGACPASRNCDMSARLEWCAG
jgi:S1-C subfamily serine protease